MESSNDFNPIRNWANELHAKDTSKKVRDVKKVQAENGERLGAKPPYGYKKKDAQSKEIIPDEATAPVVCRIFELCAAGKGPNQIARILTREQILNPTNQYYQATGTACNHLDTTRPYSWCGKTVANILENIVYLGHTLSMKHTTLSYKNKKQIRRPESEQILVKNTHAPLISQELWDIVRDVRAHKRRPPKHMEEPASGLVSPWEGDHTRRSWGGEDSGGGLPTHLAGGVDPGCRHPASDLGSGCRSPDDSREFSSPS